MILVNTDDFKRHLYVHDGYHCAKYGEFTLHSVFQPIFSSSQSIVGVEGLVRVYDGKNTLIRPDLLFNSGAVSFSDKVNISLLSNDIHLRNFSQSELNSKKLFLNTLPTVFELWVNDDENICSLKKLLDHLDIKTQQIVCELMELKGNDIEALAKGAKKFHSLGFTLAMDDYGVDESNKNRSQIINPKIIKLDRSLLLEYMDGNTVNLLEAISLAKDIGAKTIIEGIETERQLKYMQGINIDMFQGFYLAKPESLLPISIEKHS